jgi:hypothetical protein
MQAHFCPHRLPLHRKWVAPIQALMVEKGCSTVSRRTAMAPMASMRAFIASTMLSCSQRLTPGRHSLECRAPVTKTSFDRCGVGGERPSLNPLRKVGPIAAEAGNRVGPGVPPFRDQGYIVTSILELLAPPIAAMRRQRHDPRRFERHGPAVPAG